MLNLARRGTTRFLLSSLMSLTVLAGCKPPADEPTGDAPTKKEAASSQTPSGSMLEAPKLDPNPELGKAGGTRTVASISDPKTFNYFLASETSSTEILDRMFEGLVTTNGVTTEVEPALSDKWEISADGKSYTFHLRDGLAWSDGKPLTADDVVFTFEVINDVKVPSNMRDGLLVDGQFPKVEKVDVQTVKVTTVKPFAPMLRSIGVPILPKHVMGAAFAKKGKDGTPDLNKMWGIDLKDPKDIIVNGPFKMTEFVPGQRVVLERNDNYWRKDDAGKNLPYLEKYTFITVKDSDAALIKFQAKETDLNGLRGKDYEVMKAKETADNFTIHNGGPTLGTEFVMFNLTTAKDSKGKAYVEDKKSAWFRNAKFRQAMAYAIDKPTIIKNVRRNLAVPLDSFLMVGPYRNDNIQKYDFDLNKSAKLLEEAGFKKEGDTLKDAKGNPVEFTLLTNSGNTDRDATVGIIKSDWSKLGVKVNYRPIQFNVMVQKIDESHDWEAIMIGLTGGVEPHGGNNIWRTQGALHMFNMGKGTAFEPWELEIEKLYQQGATILDPAERKKVYDKTQEIELQNIPFLYTTTSLSLLAARNDIGNLKYTAYGASNWNIHNQFIKP